MFKYYLDELQLQRVKHSTISSVLTNISLSALANYHMAPMEYIALDVRAV
jgi:hypothetical protein